MTENAFPSRNPADDDSLPGGIKIALRKQLQNTDDMLPAKVIAYDRTTNRAQVQPLIVMITTANEQVQRAQIASVPVAQFGGGDFVISFPLKNGDLGWIKANDRDISLFKQFYTQSAPNTHRMHSFEDAVFIPDTMMKGVTIASEDEENLVIQNLGGTVKIAWWASLLKIIAPRVGIGGTPDANAIVDIQSTTKASIPFPKMTKAQRDAIPSPKDGMFVWLTDPSPHGASSYSSITNTWS